MKYLFTPIGVQVIESLSFTKTLYAFDFDGTLSPIVGKPDAAALPLKTMELICELAKLTPVAIISGRSLRDLKGKVSKIPCQLIGNHGLEGLSTRKKSINQAEKLCKIWRRDLEKSWADLKLDSGIFIEDKAYSLAIHYRSSRNKKKARASLFKKIATLDPTPRIILGKSVINLVPADAPHKGAALLEAMKKLNLKCALYIGDDDTDEDVFSISDAKIISVRVGQKNASQAQFYLKRQSEINALAKLLVSQVRKCKK